MRPSYQGLALVPLLTLLLGDTVHAVSGMGGYQTDSTPTTPRMGVRTEYKSASVVQRSVEQPSNAISNQCPQHCSVSGMNPSNWSVSYEIERLGKCQETMLLDFAIHNELDDPNTHVNIRACQAQGSPVLQVQSKTHSESTLSCFPASNDLEVQGSMQKVSLNITESSIAPALSVSGAVAAARHLQSYMAQTETSCQPTILFSSSGGISVGMYAGSQMHSQGVALSALEQFIADISSKDLSDNALVQYCDKAGRGADFALGIVVSSYSNLPYLQKAVKTWADGGCVEDDSTSSHWQTITFHAPQPAGLLGSKLELRADECKTVKVAPGDSCQDLATKCAISPADFTTLHSNPDFCAKLAPDQLVCCSAGTLPDLTPQGNPDGTCKTIKVSAGDSCGALASKCSISPTDFNTFNPGDDFCKTLGPNQPVCCSKGTLPDLRPKSNADGSCKAYLVTAGDNCVTIGAANGLKNPDLEKMNKLTWGWGGCENLQAGINMCLSTGRAPMPAPIPEAICGPQKPNTHPSQLLSLILTPLENLNPCPLNVCCNTYGQCGSTAEFCNKSESITGAPGTAKPGTNGCISNCGTSIKQDPTPLASPRNITYYEAFGSARGCLNMNASVFVNAAMSQYTHIHYAFGALTPNYEVDVSEFKTQWDAYVKLKVTAKRILSIGGWSFSTDPKTASIFRTGTAPQNRAKMVNNMVEFVKASGIDGLDFDWEYPGATDIPGSTPGSVDDAKNYLAFVQDLRKALPSEKSISIAAPASYWYLKAFQIAEMSKVLDYIIYMTYDLHGQWDYGSKFSDDNCPKGNCLRSHVNYTETLTALSMITKAGVSSTKVVVGVSSYGRSFEMTTPGCAGEMCEYKGPNSTATEGRCTKTAGYISNFEIEEIIKTNKNAKSYPDNLFSRSNILVYNDTQWVAYMNDSEKAWRASEYRKYNLGGISDWAVDLQTGSDVATETDPWAGKTKDSNAGNNEDPGPVLPPACDWEMRFTNLEALADVADGFTYYCNSVYALETLLTDMEASQKLYDDTNHDYDSSFLSYTKYMTDHAYDVMNSYMANDDGLWNKISPIAADNGIGKGNKFFECTYTDKKGKVSKTQRCPWKTGDLSKKGAYQLDFKLTDSAGFFDYLQKDHGIQEDWIFFGDSKYDSATWHHFPMLKSPLPLLNPKDAFLAAVPNLAEMHQNLADTFNDAKSGNWDFNYDIEDAVQAFAIPISYMRDTVAAMQSVKDVGKQEEEKEKKEHELEAQKKKEAREGLILGIISAVLLVVPFLGEAAAEIAGMATLARVIGAAGEVGNDALAVYSVVSDPVSAPMELIGMVVGARGLGKSLKRDAKSFKEIASKRQSLTAAERQSLGKSYNEKYDKKMTDIFNPSGCK